MIPKIEARKDPANARRRPNEAKNRNADSMWKMMYRGCRSNEI
jgi:hypothetical protein